MWKKNRNYYALLLSDQIARDKLDSPFKNIPPDGDLPVLSLLDTVVYLVENKAENKQESDKDS